MSGNLLQRCFICLEGLDYSGKSTVARLLADSLEKRGYNVLLTREPGGCDTAEEIRSLVLANSTDILPLTELLLFFAARNEHLHKTVVPALLDGKVVICDRFIGSSFIYQGFCKKLGVKAINGLYNLLNNYPGIATVSHELQTYLLDTTYEISRERAMSRGGVVNRLDVIDELTFNSLREAYKNLPDMSPLFIKDWNFHQIDATLQVTSVVSNIMNILFKEST